MARSFKFNGDYQVQTISQRSGEVSIPPCGVSICIRNGSMIVRIENWSFETFFDMLGPNSMGNETIDIQASNISGPVANHAELKQVLTAFIPTLGTAIPCGRGNLYLSSPPGRPSFEVTMRTNNAEDPRLEVDRTLARMGVQPKSRR